ncbi:interleukin-17 receptor B [Mesocricetus auratus]|uniref:Interleukin-17 receptor B n=1 Tax=Mesocricetus auratus TaxID=10036 RepID=A0ABM2XRM5_MESAU|nr:interleukin-17 receptor B [Mesocricetus auratus]
MVGRQRARTGHTEKAMAARPRPLRFNWRPRASRDVLGKGRGCLIGPRARVRSPHLACGTHLCAGLDSRLGCWSCSRAPRPESFAPRPPPRAPRATGRPLYGPGTRPAPARTRAGRRCGRRSPESAAAGGRQDKRTLGCPPRLRVVVGGGWVMLLVLLSLAAMCRSSALPREPTIQCGSEIGPSPEWMVQHTLTPGDLRDLRVELVTQSVSPEDFSVLMNISWILRADASIRLLKATKICVTGKGNMDSYDCVRCNYTEAFQSQTRPSGGKWAFSYAGFPVELSTLYFIGAHNIPNANMNEDSPSLSVNFTSPGCLNHVMKYKKQCVETGSLWDPNITACKKNETTVEVNFTTNPLVNSYEVFILQDMEMILGYTRVLENKPTRTSVAVLVSGESDSAVVQLAPHFPACGYDCIRREEKVVLCPETSAPFPPDNNRSMLGGWLPLVLVLLAATWVLALGIYLTWKQGRSTETSFPTTNTLLPLIKVLVVYPSDTCFHHTVCGFTDFLQSHCRSEVILGNWQTRRIAEMGPVQWLTTQKQAADKVVFLLSSDGHGLCDSACGQHAGSAMENSQDLFPLAFNLFCSDFSARAPLHKYLVVCLGGADIKGDYSALSVCPQYRLMKDAAAFHTELLRVTQNTSMKKRSQACHGS